MRIIVFLAILLTLPACAGMPVDPPTLANRSLRISKDVPGLEYQYEVCVKKILFICTRREWVKDRYDLTDVNMRQQLIDMGFVVKVRDKLVP